MSDTALLIVILLISIVSSILAGVAVFTNVAPEPPKDDPRVDQVIIGLEDIRATLEEIQKTLLLMERKIEKDAKEVSKGLIEHLDNVKITLQKNILDAAAED